MWDECQLATSEALVRRRGICTHRELSGTLCYNKNCKHHKVRTYSIYYGFPIDFSNGEFAKTVMEEIPRILGKYGTIYNPYLAFSQSNMDYMDSDFVVKVNTYALKQSDIAVFYLDPSVFTIGVITEIDLAIKYNRDIIVIAPRDMNSVYFDVISERSRVVHDLSELDSELGRIVRGKDKLYIRYGIGEGEVVEQMRWVEGDEAEFRGEERKKV